ncbi:MAG TPA: response regulator transcription factor [Bryobacteraceae bacterium]|nr:response regulator transcription factor [Bryobacteraceae bacterium]
MCSALIRVLIVERNPLMLDGLSLLIRGDPGLRLAGEAGAAEEALHLFAVEKPDVTLMDLDLLGGEGIRAIRQIRQVDPEARIIGLYLRRLDISVDEAMWAGAWGCIAKDCLDRELIAAVKAAARSGQ